MATVFHCIYVFSLYHSVKSCVDSIVKPECGAASNDLLLEGMIVALPEKPSHLCLHGDSTSFRASVSFLLLVTFLKFTLNWVFVQISR